MNYSWICNRCGEVVMPAQLTYSEHHQGCGGVCRPNNGKELISKAEVLRIVEKVVCETWCGAEGQGICDNCRAIAEIKAL